MAQQLDRLTSSPRSGRYPAFAAIALLLLLGGIPGCSGDDKGSTNPTIRHPQDFFPQEVSGMTPDGAVRTATTEDELEAIIDGGSTIYAAHNFREFAEQNYQGTVGGSQATLSCWIYELATEEDAIALHADEQIQTGNCQDRDDVGDEERLCLSFTSQMIQFRRGKYWSRLTISSSSQDAQDLMTLVATHIDQKILD